MWRSSEREKGVCESVVTEEARLSPGRSSDDGPLAQRPTVLGEAPHSAPSLTHTCSCTRHHSSCCMVDPRRPPVGIHRLFDSGPPIDPRTSPPPARTRLAPGFMADIPRGPPVGLTCSSTAIRQRPAHRPQDTPHTRTPGFTDGNGMVHTIAGEGGSLPTRASSPRERAR